MHKQLELWPTEQPDTAAPITLETLSTTDQAALVAALTGLIIKVVHPKPQGPKKENGHERKGQD